MMKRIIVAGESHGHTIVVTDADASVRVAFPAYMLGMTADSAEALAQALMDAAARARRTETDPPKEPHA